MTQHWVLTCLGISWRHTVCEILTRCTQRIRGLWSMHYINLHFTCLFTYMFICHVGSRLVWVWAKWTSQYDVFSRRSRPDTGRVEIHHGAWWGWDWVTGNEGLAVCTTDGSWTTTAATAAAAACGNRAPAAGAAYRVPAQREASWAGYQQSYNGMCTCAYICLCRWLGGVVVGHRTLDQMVVSLIPGRAAIR